MHFSFFAGLLASLLPAKMRRSVVGEHIGDLQAPSIVTGIVQTAAMLGLLYARYLPFVRSQMESFGTREMLAAAEQHGETSVMAVGAAVTVAYMIQPVSIILIYFAFEGVVRAVAAFIHGEWIGTLPLYLAEQAVQEVKARKAERELGPRVADTVEHGNVAEECELRIASSRPKGWTSSHTIVYEGQMYELASTETAEPPRRFVYVLKKAPESKVVRGIREYVPEQVE